jgi:ketosteroid isomerase-like protein
MRLLDWTLKEVVMIELLLERPVLVGLTGLVVAVLAGLFWTQTGHKAALVSALLIALATIVLVAVSLQIQTDREKIERILHDVGAALQRNDYESVFSVMHPNAAVAVSRARAELPRYTFEVARVTHIKSILVETARRPETAIAEFNVRVDVTVDGQKFAVPRFVKIYFAKHEGRWLVRDYEHFEPTAGFRESQQR